MGDVWTEEVGFSAEAEARFERENAARKFDEAEAELEGGARDRADELREYLTDLVAYEASKVRRAPGHGRGPYQGKQPSLGFDRF